MKRTRETLLIRDAGDIPPIDLLRKIPRTKKLRLLFEGSVTEQREAVGKQLKEQLEDFLVGIHTQDPEINIARLISAEEIAPYQDFFESCAKDYRKLATELIYALAHKLNVNIAENYPLLTFNAFKAGRKQTGKMDDWRYFLHGYHCGFENQVTGQSIEVPLIYGLDFGDLDPYFFSHFIKSTNQYQPLPVAIYEDFHDGVIINQTMLELGRFEKIAASIPGYVGIAASDRSNVDIARFQSAQRKVIRRFSLMRLLGKKDI